ARALWELGMLKQQQGHLEEALPLLLKARIGLSLVNSPEMQRLKEQLARLRAQMGESAFNTRINSLAGEEPEPAYGLAQAEWERML
ncbi:MAG TPA: hypothetical protein VKX46_15110, partial [Ktedonobacteraceae bacterium]|nr:hypothetical protein [Ktedonobacteraceae bacterium]